VSREDELEAGLPEALDEIDDFAAWMTGDVAHARGAQTLADQTRDGGIGQAESLSQGITRPGDDLR
jgi:hypothetical protein